MFAPRPKPKPALIVLIDAAGVVIAKIQSKAEAAQKLEVVR
jgi:hypothetical protein